MFVGRYIRCPGIYCFHFAERGDRIAPGSYESLDQADTDLGPPREDDDGCALPALFGRCSREDPTSERDRYEPCEPYLRRDGLPDDYFVVPKA